MGEFNIDAIPMVITWLVCVLGIPGNILSAIVWLRRRKNSSAIYLAALAINDLVFLLICLGHTLMPLNREFQLYWISSSYLLLSAHTLEPLLILGFFVERLFAILRLLQVSFSIHYIYSQCWVIN